MNAKMLLLLIVIPLSVAIPAQAQDTEHALPKLSPAASAMPSASHEMPRPRQLGGFLTPGQVDRWSFEGEKGETIIVHVASREFDPVVGLSKTEKKEDKILLEVNDEGNQGSFSVRLPEKGQYKIRIHAFKFQGGGNFTMRVQRFQAKPLTLDKPLVGTFDQEGNSYHYFQVAKDQILIPELKGASSERWMLLNYKGREMERWSDTVLVEEVGEKSASGECSLIVSGEPDQRYDLLVRVAKRQDLVEGKTLAGNLQQGELDVLSFKGKPGDFRLLEVEKKGDVISRLKYAPLEKKSKRDVARTRKRTA